MSRKYYLLDCKKFVLGRMATKIAFLLEGKHKACYAPNIGGNDFIIAINSDKIRVTGKKKEGKIYHSFSGYPGGVSSKNLKRAIEQDSRKVIRDAVFGMLPKNKLRNKMIKKLLIFKDENHNMKFPITEIIEL